MEQQTQALAYFNAHANDWQNKAVNPDYSVIDNRHKAVLEILKLYPNNSSLLDVGCGTGQLAIQASHLGWEALGVDFAPEMIDVCLHNNQSQGAQAKFLCSSIFDFRVAENSFDVISAQGFIEYITLTQLEQFLNLAHRALKKGGVLVLGSRNRLFNLHSLNEFTTMEAELGSIPHLIKESQILQTAPTQEAALHELAQLNVDYIQPESHHHTGIIVDTRYQFTPADLMARLSKSHLTPQQLFPIHFHALPISLLAHPETLKLHQQLAKIASDNWIHCHPLIPYASSFVIAAKKA